MATITPERKLVTLINIFTVQPEKQQELISILNKAGDEVMIHLPGFISATIHRSLDGTRVTNYAQWESMEDFQRMLKNPTAAPHLEAARRLAEKIEPGLYDVVHSNERREL